MFEIQLIDRGARCIKNKETEANCRFARCYYCAEKKAQKGINLILLKARKMMDKKRPQ